jgi:hypothetical protein
VEVRLRQRLHSRRAAETGDALAALDPAHLVAKLSRDPDVVVLALRDVQNVGLLVAEGGLAPLVVGEELRVRLGNAGIVGADGVVEGIAERVRVAGERDAVRIGHRHQPELRAQALQRLDRIRERPPAQHRELEHVAGRIVGGKSELLGEMAIDMEHRLARALVMLVAAALVGLEDLLVAELGRRLAGDLAHRGEHAGLEIDQGADDVEGENLEIAERGC